MLPRVLEFLFKYVNKELSESRDLEYLVKCSYLEIYNEHIIDLLNCESGSL